MIRKINIETSKNTRIAADCEYIVCNHIHEKLTVRILRKLSDSTTNTSGRTMISDTATKILQSYHGGEYTDPLYDDISGAVLDELFILFSEGNATVSLPAGVVLFGTYEKESKDGETKVCSYVNRLFSAVRKTMSLFGNGTNTSGIVFNSDIVYMTDDGHDKAATHDSVQFRKVAAEQWDGYIDSVAVADTIRDFWGFLDRKVSPERAKVLKKTIVRLMSTDTIKDIANKEKVAVSTIARRRDTIQEYWKEYSDMEGYSVGILKHTKSRETAAASSILAYIANWKEEEARKNPGYGIPKKYQEWLTGETADFSSVSYGRIPAPEKCGFSDLNRAEKRANLRAAAAFHSLHPERLEKTEDGRKEDREKAMSTAFSMASEIYMGTCHNWQNAHEIKDKDGKIVLKLKEGSTAINKDWTAFFSAGEILDFLRR